MDFQGLPCRIGSLSTKRPLNTTLELPFLSLPRPTEKVRYALYLQHLVHRFFLIPFGGLLILLMRWRGYRIEDHQAIRQRYKEITREKGPLLICANHLTFIDSALLIWAFGSTASYTFNFRPFPWNLPAGDFFKKKLHFRIVAYLMKCIFIHRDGTKEHKEEILGNCRYLLEKGESVMLFPEGRRSRIGIFDREHITFGVGKLLHAVPTCRVLCVYLRSDQQLGFSNYPPRGSRFEILMQVIRPETVQRGRQAYFELTSQIAHTIQQLETQYFAKHGQVALPARERQPTALVTGASSGIGEALAREFAKKGHNLVLVARRKEKLENLALEVEKYYGVKTTVIVSDLSTEEGTNRVMDQVSNLSIDVLVNNAGFGIHGFFAETDFSDEARLISLQIHSVLKLTKHCVNSMRKKGKGAILNVASVYGYASVPQQSVYAASKAFMVSFSESLANEVRGTGIQVSVVCPGVTQTEFRKSAGIQEKPQSGMTAERVAQLSYQGLKQGRKVIVPGVVNQVFVASVRHLPQGMVGNLLNFINRRRGVNAHV